MQLHPTHVMRTIAIAPLILAIGGAASARAQPSAAETITSAWVAAPPAPTSPPYRGTGSGAFTATGAVNDSGTLSLQAQDTAVASPIIGVVHADEILTSQDGTLELRCHRSSTDFSDLSAVPGAGSCAITASTGVYAGLHGDGTINSLIDVIARTETDTIVLNVP